MTIETKQEPKVTSIKAIKAKPRRQEQLSKLLNRKSGATIVTDSNCFWLATAYGTGCTVDAAQSRNCD